MSYIYICMCIRCKQGVHAGNVTACPEAEAESQVGILSFHLLL